MKKTKKLLLASLLSTVSLFAGFTTVDCTNQTHLDILKVPQIECKALDAFWHAMGDGEGWEDKSTWDTLTFAGDWNGIFMNDDNTSIQILAFGMFENTLHGTLPEEIGDFLNLELFSIQRSFLTGGIPKSINKLQLLKTINMQHNQLSGTLPDLILPDLDSIVLAYNNFTGNIPESYGNITGLTDLLLERNNLSGVLPDLSQLSVLEDFRIHANKFTFSDIEPQINYIKDLYPILYNDQEDINESTHPTVYFDTILSIEPSLAVNPSKNDYYTWKKDSKIIENYNGARVYTKINATLDDVGCYSYSVSNTKVTLPSDGGSIRRNLILHSNTCINVEHDNTPIVTNINYKTQISTDEDYLYTSTISDLDVGDVLSVTPGTLPDWLNFTSDDSSFTITSNSNTKEIRSYDINITVTDGKIPHYIAYSINVTPSNAELPNGFTLTNGAYIHDDTLRSISGDGNVSLPLDGVRIEELCTGEKQAFIALASDGQLRTGFKDCTPPLVETETFTTELPNQTKASIVTNNSEKMILIELPLGDDMTLGGN